MKKTFATLIALAGIAVGEASAITLSDFSQIDLSSLTGDNKDTYTLSTTTKVWTLAVTIDSQAVRSYMEKGVKVYPTGTTDAPEGAIVSGAANSGLQIFDAKLANNSSIGIDTNFGSENNQIKSSGFYGSWNGAGSSAPVGNYNVNSVNVAPFNWDNIGSIALTLSYKYQDDNSTAIGTNVAIAVYDKNGDLLGSSYGSNTGLRTDSSLTSIAFNDAVTSAYLYNQYLAKDDVTSLTQELGKAALIPEPTTATLSLLALAGLAARRRRK